MKGGITRRAAAHRHAVEVYVVLPADRWGDSSVDYDGFTASSAERADLAAQVVFSGERDGELPTAVVVTKDGAPTRMYAWAHVGAVITPAWTSLRPQTHGVRRRTARRGDVQAVVVAGQSRVERAKRLLGIT